MKTYVATERVALTQDGKSLVPYESEGANSLFAAEGVKKTEAELAAFDNAADFFAEESAGAPQKRVAPEPQPASGKPAKIVKSK